MLGIRGMDGWNVLRSTVLGTWGKKRLLSRKSATKWSGSEFPVRNSGNIHLAHLGFSDINTPEVMTIWWHRVNRKPMSFLWLKTNGKKQSLRKSCVKLRSVKRSCWFQNSFMNTIRPSWVIILAHVRMNKTYRIRHFSSQKNCSEIIHVDFLYVFIKLRKRPCKHELALRTHVSQAKALKHV